LNVTGQLKHMIINKLINSKNKKNG
jgi:hypothetical protein